MLKILVTLALGAGLLLPAAAFADEGNGGDRIVAHEMVQAASISLEVTQDEPINVGTVAGSDRAPSGPYFEQRQENYGQ